ncbi:MAG: hypothetical protein VX223_10790 [Myxococcota bacterium]|nr:hypothetical protein [Myxococcota bacterium]
MSLRPPPSRYRPMCAVTLTVFFTVVFITLSSAAAPPTARTGIRQQFVDFGAQIIDGQIRRPQDTLIQGRETPTFGPMLQWKRRSFLPQLRLDGASLR